ncbi:hemerythrin domain-containing protein [Roseateles sp. P5_E4]
MHTSLQEILAVHGTATAPRFDIYASIHKGLRLMLADLVTSAGCVDPGDPASLQQLAGKVEAAADFCASHLKHENAFVHPALERAQPGTSQRIATEHVEHERDIEALRTHARALAGCPPQDCAAACRALYHAVSLFAAHNLAHMHLEETEHNAVLWAHLDDAGIMAIHGQILAALSPAEMMASLRWMLPALAPAERLGLLGGMRANAPAPVFGAVLAMAREQLNDDDWAALARGLGLPVAPGLAA